jgi:D-alanyl-D-alanine carboxypeptidase
VFLDAEDRFGSAVLALEYGFVAHERSRLVEKGDFYTRSDVPFHREKEIGLVAGDDVAALVDADAKVERRVEVRDELPDRAKPGARLGTVIATVDGERVGESPLVAREGYERASVWQRVWYTVEGIFVEEK